MNNNKLQALLITHLSKYGSVKLLLPDGIVLEIGVNQLGHDGQLVHVEDYCWVMASREDRITVLDSYNCGVRFADDKNTVVFEDTIINHEGDTVRHLDVV
jgi:hypothetical protein